jgi:hypothetical protein
VTDDHHGFLNFFCCFQLTRLSFSLPPLLPEIFLPEICNNTTFFTPESLFPNSEQVFDWILNQQELMTLVRDHG